MSTPRFASRVLDLIESVTSSVDQPKHIWYGRQLVWTYMSQDRTFSGSIYRLHKTPNIPFELSVEDEESGNLLFRKLYPTQALAQQAWDRVKRLSKADATRTLNSPA